MISDQAGQYKRQYQALEKVLIIDRASRCFLFDSEGFHRVYRSSCSFAYVLSVIAQLPLCTLVSVISSYQLVILLLDYVVSLSWSG